MSKQKILLIVDNQKIAFKCFEFLNKEKIVNIVCINHEEASKIIFNSNQQIDGIVVGRLINSNSIDMLKKYVEEREKSIDIEQYKNAEDFIRAAKLVLKMD